MKYIIFSDIHSNLPALEAVSGLFTGADKLINAGDIVGYGADPLGCIDVVRSLGSVNVMGNHDSAIIGRTDILNFNSRAAQAVCWTKENLNQTGREFLEDIPMEYRDDGITVVHGSLHDSEEFMYLFDMAGAMHTFQLMETDICIVGHTHIPRVFAMKEGRISTCPTDVVQMKEGCKYIVNAGSVGQPRDGNNKSCFCVYDSEKRTIEFKRVSYDIERAKKRISEEGLPESLGDRLLFGL